jgi:hypothetical protein
MIAAANSSSVPAFRGVRSASEDGICFWEASRSSTPTTGRLNLSRKTSINRLNAPSGIAAYAVHSERQTNEQHSNHVSNQFTNLVHGFHLSCRGEA